MILSDQTFEAVKRGEAVRIAADDVEMVILRADVYDRVRNMVEGDLTHEELQDILARSADGSDWTDPQMDIYDDYDKHRK